MPRGELGKIANTFWLSNWNHPPTKTIRVPVCFEEDCLRYARQLDALEGEAPKDSGFIECLEEIRDHFLLTIPPTKRKEASKLLNQFIKFADKPL